MLGQVERHPNRDLFTYSERGSLTDLELTGWLVSEPEISLCLPLQGYS